MDLSETEFSFFDTNGIRLHAAAAGPADGPLVILLHGFPEFWYGWRGQIPALAAAGFRVLAPDQRGYNLSDKPAWPVGYRIETLVKDVLGLIDAAGRERAFVVGHDWGGVVALALAAVCPERVEKLTVLNASLPQIMRRAVLRDPRQAFMSLYILAFQFPRLPEALWRANGFRAGLRSLRASSRPGTFSDAELARYTAAWAQPGAQTAMLNWYRASLRFPFFVPDLRIKVPTRIFWGKDDAFLSRAAALETLRACTHAELSFLDTTHWVQHEAAGEVNRRLIEWLRAP
ncbi:MAG TPA: alpha/beta hydrolase [Anaerolineaceae bacterium]|nr:alpha/beta hydrolase [Anaerolineaceae bacterium]